MYYVFWCCMKAAKHVNNANDYVTQCAVWHKTEFEFKYRLNYCLEPGGISPVTVTAHSQCLPCVGSSGKVDDKGTVVPRRFSLYTFNVRSDGLNGSYTCTYLSFLTTPFDRHGTSTTKRVQFRTMSICIIENVRIIYELNRPGDHLIWGSSYPNSASGRDTKSAQT